MNDADTATMRVHSRACVAPLIGAVLALACLLAGDSADATPRTPTDDAEVLAVVPAGARPARDASRSAAATRLDVALPLAQYYIAQSRSSGDVRFLGYADAVLEPWLERSPPVPTALVLDASILQTRHRFEPALLQLDRALAANPTDAQAWLIRATVERVLGRYPAALESCEHLRTLVDPLVESLCGESIRALTGHLAEAYRRLSQADGYQILPIRVRAWRDSELGEMAVRAGDDDSAERWFRDGLRTAPDDLYTRAALADLLLRQQRAAETVALVENYASFEPLLLRLALAHRLTHDPALSGERGRLHEAFDVEERRGEAVHRREQARFLLDIEDQPEAALEIALRNWQTQREPDDAWIALRAAAAAHRPQAADPVRRFVERVGLEDRREHGS